MIIDGKALSLSVKTELKEKVSDFERQFGRKISLAVVLVGNNPASQVYVKNKIKATEFIGINSVSVILKEDSTLEEIKDKVINLADDSSIDGILVQLPLPKGIDENEVLKLIPPEKDVDGFSSANVGNLLLGKPSVVACTPLGVLTMIKSVNYDLKGKNAVVIGRSNIVGKPMALLLLQEDCTVTICHSKTKNLTEICKNADVLIVAIGKANFVKEDMVKDGALVIDVGINRTENGIVGDVDFENVKNKASYISPVPGGVGPMTIAMLMQNTYNCALKRVKNGL
ncbi:MAG: bifunctional methylenetetrahydrofolate dehydrogenase/methenyltetrahydrofolate cyclohydrolase FolD [Clostridia bacterium]|nr:bifunctional methylenetetrahydrofolate dehydrogenase/methenyltetrahydrofolate cyclohydrolase FolD [Clostridia bacterium]